MSSNRKHKVFIRYMMSYLFVLLMAFTIGSSMYIQALRVVEDGAKEANLAMLEQCKEIMERRLNEVDNIVAQFALNNRVNNLLINHQAAQGPAAYKLFELCRDFSAYGVVNNFISNYFIYFKNSNVVLTKDTVYSNLKYFYNQFFASEDMNYASFVNNLLDTYHNDEFIHSVSYTNNGRKYSMLAYVQSIPLWAFGENYKGNIVILIDENEILKMLSHINLGSNGWAYIVDDKGRIITGISANGIIQLIDMQDIDENGYMRNNRSGNRMLVTSTVSSTNGWKYVSVVPSDIAMMRVEYIKEIFVNILWILLLTCFPTACIMAYSNSKPLRELVNTIGKYMSDEPINNMNEYVYLNHAVDRFVSRNNMLEKQIEEQIPIMKSTFFYKLLRGEVNNEMEMEEMMLHIGINPIGNGFIVLITRINGYNGAITRDTLEELHIKRLLLNEILEVEASESIYVSDVGDDKIAAIIPNNKQDAESFRVYLSALAKKVITKVYSNEYSMCLSFAAGSICKNLYTISTSFEEALVALNSRLVTPNSDIIWYKDVQKNSKEYYYYPIDIESHIIRLSLAGAIDEIEKILMKIYDENFKNRYLPGNIARQLMYEMNSTLIKIYSQLELDFDQFMELSIENLNFSEVSYQLFASIITAYQKVCSIVNGRKKSHNKKLGEDLITYIDNNYMDKNMCLAQITLHFNMTETYISHFFKEHTGENFSTYLEKVRIKNAHRLLSETDMSINAISDLVGYNSAHVFRRAYKRIFGTSPNLVRNSVQISTERL